MEKINELLSILKSDFATSERNEFATTSVINELLKITTNEKIREQIVSETDFVDVILREISCFPESDRGKCWESLRYLTISKKNHRVVISHLMRVRHLFICPPSFGQNHFFQTLLNLSSDTEPSTMIELCTEEVTAMLVECLNSLGDDIKIPILSIVLKFAENKEYRVFLCTHKLLESLQLILCGPAKPLRVKACQIIYHLSVPQENKSIFFSPSIDMLRPIVSVLCLRAKDERKSIFNILGALINLTGCGSHERAKEKKIMTELCSPRLGLLQALTGLATSGGGAAVADILSRACGVLWNMAENSHPEHVVELLRCGTHTAMLRLIAESGAKSEPACLNFLMNLAHHSAAEAPLRAEGVFKIVRPLLSSTSSEGLKAMFIVAFLVGKRDPAPASAPSSQTAYDAEVAYDEEAACLHQYPETIDRLVGVLREIIEARHGPDYRLGTFSLSIVLRACLAMSISDANKARLVRGPLLSLLKKILEMFVGDAPGIPFCGGGGLDPDSAVLACETALHLSFAGADERDHLQRFSAVDLRPVVAELLASKRLSIEDSRTAQSLLSRLTLPAPPKEGKHVMISYAWQSGSAPELVKKLAAALREAGFDVWRDEEGSSVLPPMGLRVNDAMAAAIQCSHTMIVCVSPEYVVSGNCRYEADYASCFEKRGEIDIHYVMMNPTFTRASGWMGIMIGSKLWYGLFNDAALQPTAAALAQLIARRLVPAVAPCAVAAGPKKARSPPVPAAAFGGLPELLHDRFVLAEAQVAARVLPQQLALAKAARNATRAKALTADAHAAALSARAVIEKRRAAGAPADTGFDTASAPEVLLALGALAQELNTHYDELFDSGSFDAAVSCEDSLRRIAALRAMLENL